MDLLQRRRGMMMPGEAGTAVVWNQMAKGFNADDYDTMWNTSRYYTHAVSGNVVTYTIVTGATAKSPAQKTGAWNVSTVSGHKYLVGFTANYSEAHATTYNIIFGIDAARSGQKYAGANEWKEMYVVVTASSDVSAAALYFYLRTQGMTAGSTVKVRNALFIDLTAMYGAGSEPTVDKFFRDFPLPDTGYTYTDGEIIII